MDIWHIIIIILLIPCALISCVETYYWYVKYYVLWPQIELTHPGELNKIGKTPIWEMWSGEAEIDQYLISREYLKLNDPSLNETCNKVAAWTEFRYKFQLKMAGFGHLFMWVAFFVFMAYVIQKAT